MRTLLRRLRPAIPGGASWIPEVLEAGDIELDRRSRTCRLRRATRELTGEDMSKRDTRPGPFLRKPPL